MIQSLRRCLTCCGGPRVADESGGASPAATNGSSESGADAVAPQASQLTWNEELAVKLRQRVAEHAAEQRAAAAAATMPQQLRVMQSQGSEEPGLAVNVTVDASQEAQHGQVGWRTLRRAVLPVAALASAHHKFPTFPAWRPSSTFGGELPAVFGLMRARQASHRCMARSPTTTAEQGRPRSLYEAAAQGDEATVKALVHTVPVDAVHPLAVSGGSKGGRRRWLTS